MLKEILKELRDGEPLILEWYMNHMGNEAPSKVLKFEDGVWELHNLSCTNSSWVGLGGCHCHWHDTYITEHLEREEALQLIREYIKKKEMEKQKREEEVAFLDELIASLDDNE